MRRTKEKRGTEGGLGRRNKTGQKKKKQQENLFTTKKGNEM